MAIDGGMREKLEAGTKLVATYKKTEHTCEVVAGEDSKLRFRLADGRVFKSPSAAGSAVMGGVACNGWRFWSIAGEEAGEAAETAEAPEADTNQARRARADTKAAKRAKVEARKANRAKAAAAEAAAEPDEATE